MKGLRRVKEYRRALASLADSDVGVALACFTFSSLPQKLEAVEAMQAIENEPGFAGWGTFTKRPKGPATKVGRARPSRKEGGPDR